MNICSAEIRKGYPYAPRLNSLPPHPLPKMLGILFRRIATDDGITPENVLALSFVKYSGRYFPSFTLRVLFAKFYSASLIHFP